VRGVPKPLTTVEVILRSEEAALSFVAGNIVFAIVEWPGAALALATPGAADVVTVVG
jgi:hypothetical protein